MNALDPRVTPSEIVHHLNRLALLWRLRDAL